MTINYDKLEKSTTRVKLNLLENSYEKRADKKWDDKTINEKTFCNEFYTIKKSIMFVQTEGLEDENFVGYIRLMHHLRKDIDWLFDFAFKRDLLVENVDGFSYDGVPLVDELEIFYSEYTGRYYVDFDEAIKHHKAECDMTEEEIKQANEDLDIYFTSYQH